MSVCSILLLTDEETGACTSLEEMMKGGELGMDKKFASLSELVSEKTLNVVGFTDMMEIHPKVCYYTHACIQTHAHSHYTCTQTVVAVTPTQ